jgi:hypothetical protein
VIFTAPKSSLGNAFLELSYFFNNVAVVFKVRIAPLASQNHTLVHNMNVTPSHITLNCKS